MAETKGDEDEWGSFPDVLTSRNRTFSERSDDFGEFCDDTTKVNDFDSHSFFSQERKDMHTLESCFHHSQTSQVQPSPLQDFPANSHDDALSEKNRLWEVLVSGLGAIRHTKWRTSQFEKSHTTSLRLQESKVTANPMITVDNKSYKGIFDFHSMFKRKHRKTASFSDSSFLRTISIPQNNISADKRLSHSAQDLNSVSTSEDLTTLSSKTSSKTTSKTAESLSVRTLNIEPDVTLTVDTLSVEDTLKRHRRTGSSSSFDECRAAKGLSALSFKEVQQLRDELAAYVKEFSDVLVTELTRRDEQIREKELKNRFISSLLTVQNRVREFGSKKSKGRIILSNSGPKPKYLSTVIPYQEQLGGPSTEVLEKLIEIMNAMSADSSSVPSLLTEYILKVLCV